MKGRGHAKVLQGHTMSGQKLEVAQHHDNTHTHPLCSVRSLKITLEEKRVVRESETLMQTFQNSIKFNLNIENRLST